MIMKILYELYMAAVDGFKFLMILLFIFVVLQLVYPF